MKRKIIFPKAKTLGARPWGKEVLLCLIPKVLSLKILKIKKGKKGGLQYHHKKNECGYILKGKLIVRYDNGRGKLVKKFLLFNNPIIKTLSRFCGTLYSAEFNNLYSIFVTIKVEFRLISNSFSCDTNEYLLSNKYLGIVLLIFIL